MRIHKLFYIILLFCVAFLAMPLHVFSQSSVTSPYSRFGIGELAPQNNLRSRSMGYISQGLHEPNSINFSNPAAYSAFDSLSFLFDFSISGTFNTIRSESEKSKTSTASVDYITIGMPILKRWHTALGLLPISAIGYSIYDIIQPEDLPTGEFTGRQFQFFVGDGAYNKFFWGNSFKINKNFAVGLNAGYMFGNSNYIRTLSFDTITIRTTKIINDVYVSGFTFEPGIQYYATLASKDRLIVGATYNIQKEMNAENDTWVISMFGGDGNNMGSYPDTISKNVINGKLKMPSSFTVGFSYERPGRFIVGGDFQWTDWGKYEMFGQNDNLSNTWRVSLGGEIIPSSKASAKYFQRVAYRVGFRTQQNIFEFNGNSVNDYAFTGGFGLPLTRSKTMINLYFEFGKKGTTENRLVQENYFKIGVGLSLHEMWFYKRQYR